MALSLDGDGNGLGVADLAALLGAGNRGGGGFGGDGIYGLITLLVALSFFGGGGFGGFGGGGILPWLMMLMMNNGGGMGGSGSTVIMPANGGGCGCNNSCAEAVQGAANQGAIMTALGGISGSVNDGFSAAEIAAGARQLATVQQLNNNQVSNLQQLFGLQTTLDGHLDTLSAALAQCCCDNKSATQDVKFTVATDGAQTRLAISEGVQKILDKLCTQELETVKTQLSAALTEIANLRNEKSQSSQNSFIQSALITLAQYLRPPINPAFLVNPPYSTPDSGTATTATT